MSPPAHLNSNWPTAAPGASEESTLSFPASYLLSLVPSGMSCSTSTIALTATKLQTSSMTRPSGPIMTSFANQTTFGTVTLTVPHPPTADVSVAALTQQTRSLDLHAPFISTKVRTPVPEVTVASFDVFTSLAEPPASIAVEPNTIKINSGPTPNTSFSNHSTAGSSPSTISPAAIASITLGCAAFICILIALAIFLYRRRKAKNTQPDAEAPRSGETLTENMERVRDRRRKRWSPSETAINMERFEKLKELIVAKNRAAAAKKASVTEGEQEEGATEMKPSPHMTRLGADRRPSGLTMHHPMPMQAVSMQNGHLDIGRAM